MSKRRGLEQFADVRGGLAKKRASVLFFLFFFFWGGGDTPIHTISKKGEGGF